MRDERFAKTYTRAHWHKASEFMFWGCFSFDKKGPYHIWKTETAKEKKAAKKEINKINKINELLSTSLTVSRIHRNSVVTGLLKVIECEQHERSHGTARGDQVRVTRAWFYDHYIGRVKSLMDLTF